MLEKITLDSVALSLLVISLVVLWIAVRAIVIRKTALIVLHKNLSEKMPIWCLSSFVVVSGLMGILYRLNVRAFYNALELFAFIFGFTFVCYTIVLLQNVEKIEKQGRNVIKSALVLMFLAIPLLTFLTMSSITVCGCFPPEMCNC